jgi:hypothetical protein
MRTATLLSLLCVAGALSACGSSTPGHSVEFVASNTDSVLLDFAAKPPGELAATDNVAAQQCQLFGKSKAVLESLNTRGDGGTIRAIYLCKGGTQSADATTTQTSATLRRQ